MKKIIALFVMLSISLSACLPAALQPQAVNPTLISEAALQATAAVLSQQTLQALPTQTSAPSETPIVTTPTNTAILDTPTETQNPVLLTLTATLGTGTVPAGTEATGFIASTGTLQSSVASNNTPNPLTPTTTPHPQFYGTLPPEIPYAHVILSNRAEADVYISLRCETSKGNVTILEYPVKRIIEVDAPVGSYTYVAWVGGRQFTGAFSLGHQDTVKIEFFKNRIKIK